MSQTVLTPIQLKQDNYSVVAGDLTVTPVALDATNGNSFTATGREVLVIQNTDASAHTFAITSVTDALGRSDSSMSAYSVAANGFAAIQMNTLAGWIQPTGVVNLTTSSALLKILVLRLN
jgi:hypothetical protein